MSGFVEIICKTCRVGVALPQRTCDAKRQAVKFCRRHGDHDWTMIHTRQEARPAGITMETP